MILELATVEKSNKELSNEVERNRSKIEELTKSLDKVTLENKEIQRDKEAHVYVEVLAVDIYTVCFRHNKLKKGLLY